MATGSVLNRSIDLARNLSAQTPSMPFQNPYLARDVQQYFPTVQQQEIDDRPTWDMINQLEAERQKDKQSYESIINSQRELFSNYEQRLANQPVMYNNQYVMTNNQTYQPTWREVQGGINTGRSIAEDHNNPLNEKIYGSKQTGRGVYKVYPSVEQGFLGNYKLLQSYPQKHNANTINSIISTWASGDPKVPEYITRVSERTGFKPDQVLDVNNLDTASRLMHAMAIEESPLGRQYTPEQIRGFLSRQPTGLAGASRMNNGNYVNSAIQLAPSLQYDLNRRGTKGYTDCSNFLARSLINSGIDVNPNMTTATMPRDLAQAGFQMINFDPNNLQAGDILYIPASKGKLGHSEIYLGNGKTIGARNKTAGVGVHNMYKGMATYVFRRL